MNELQSVGMTNAFISHLEIDDRDSPFWFYCRPPYYWKSSPISERGILPLWECGTTVYYYDPKTSRYESCDLEDIDEINYSFPSIQPLLALLFIQAYEGEVSESDLRLHAELFGFKYVEDMLLELETNEIEHELWLSSFLSKCA